LGNEPEPRKRPSGSKTRSPKANKEKPQKNENSKKSAQRKLVKRTWTSCKLPRVSGDREV